MEQSQDQYRWRKCIGVVFFTLEMNLLAGTIFGFPGIFKILTQNQIYQHKCSSSSMNPCDEQTKQYQNAMTLGIAFFELPMFFIGILIDKFGCRFVKLIGILCHMIGWISLALLQPGRDYLIYIHCVFSSSSGMIILITSFTSSNYFSKSRAFVSSLLTGAVISATMWFSIFQIIIDSGRTTLSVLSYIWLGFGLIMLISSFLFLDWSFPCFNLPYQFDGAFESKDQSDSQSVWKHLRNPLYILVVLFLSILLIPSVFLSVTWEPWINHVTDHDKSTAKQYTFAYTISTVSALVICPVNGFLLGFKADKNKTQKLFNISVVETIAWIFNIVLCILPMFLSSSIIIPVIIINCFARSTIIAGCQSVLSTCFPSKYIGRLTGVMWTIAGAIIFIEFALVKLTNDITKAYRAWLIVLGLVVLMSIHLIQIWIEYFREKKKEKRSNNSDTQMAQL